MAVQSSILATTNLSSSDEHLCPTAWDAVYMPALRPARRCKFPHAVFAWSPAALITSLARAQRRVSHIPVSHTPGLLSSTTRLHDISSLKAAQRGEKLSIQSASLVTTTHNSSDAYPNRRRQLRSSIASAPSVPTAPERYYTTHELCANDA